MAEVINLFPNRPYRRHVAGARETFFRAFEAVMTECPCKECTKYRSLVRVDPAAAAEYLEEISNYPERN